MPGKLPHIQFYPGDWLRDNISGCSLAAQGLWLRMMFVGHDSDRYGYLSMNGLPIPPGSIARRCGCTPEQYETLLAELTDAGVPSRTPEGILFSRRMVKDAQEREANARRQEKHRRKRNAEGNGVSNASVTPNEDDSDNEAESLDCQLQEIFAHYRKYHARALRNPQPTSKEWRHAKARLAEGYSVADLQKAIDGCHKTPHNLGDNERGEKYLDLELILRDSAHVERFIRNADDPPKPRVQISREQAREHSNLGAINEFLDSHGIRPGDGQPLRIEENR